MFGLRFSHVACTLLTGMAISFVVSPDATAQAQTKATGQFEELFNGKNLEGWDGDPQFWRVENGELVGETTATKKADKNTFLIYRPKKFFNFELQFKYQVTGYNSGVQYRSRERGKWVVSGYQADFEARCHKSPGGLKDRFSGMLYDERGRTFLARRGEAVLIHADPTNRKKSRVEVVGRLGNPELLEKKIKRDDWNDFRIIANGHQFTHIINGTVMATAVDEDLNNRVPGGLIAFQLHAGPAMKIRLKDIRLRQILGRNKPKSSSTGGK